MRILTPQAASAIIARETEEVFLACLTLTHPDLETIRIVNNTETVIRTVGSYVPYPFEAILPEDTDAASPHVMVRIDNCDREVTRKLRDLEGVPKCTIEVILASDPNTVEVGPFDFAVLSAEYDALLINVSLGYEEDFLNQAVPSQIYSPTTSPGLFV